MATGKRARSAAQPREPRRPPRLANAGNACPAHVPCTYWRARRRLARRPARFGQKMDPMSPHAAAPTTGRACERAGPAHAHRPARLLHEAAQWPRDGASNLASFPLQCPRPGPPVRLVRRPCCTMNPHGRQSNLAAGNGHLSGTLRMHVGRLICRASRAGTGGDMAIDPAAESAHLLNYEPNRGRLSVRRPSFRGLPPNWGQSSRRHAALSASSEAAGGETLAGRSIGPAPRPSHLEAASLVARALSIRDPIRRPAFTGDGISKAAD